MVDLVNDNGPFGTITRPVRIDGPWPGDLLEDHRERTLRYSGPVLLDAFYAVQGLGNDDLLQRWADEVERAGVQLHGWNEPELRVFRTALWRSAHRWLVDNSELIDHEPELKELMKILRVPA